MSNQKQVFTLLKELSGQANILTIPRFYISLLDGDIYAALLLSQIVYWSDRSNRKDGYFYKTYSDWESEIGLSKYLVMQAIKKLKELGILETIVKKANGAPTVHYKLDCELFTDLIIKKLNNGKSKDLTIESEGSSLSLTEITTEITTEIKDTIAPKAGALDESAVEDGSAEKDPFLEKYPLLKKMPRENSLILAAFIEATGIEPIDKDYSLWLKASWDLRKRGVTDDVVKQAVSKMRRDGLTISTPLSIIKVCVSLKASNGGNGHVYHDAEAEMERYKQESIDYWKGIEAQGNGRETVNAIDASGEQFGH